jgi:hypothetical protein
VAIQYEVEDGVVILRVAPAGFTFLRDALCAVATDPAARPKMPLLIDVRTEPGSHRYEDVRWRVQILDEMREQFGPRWAFLTGPDDVPLGVRSMLAVFASVGRLRVRMFAEKDAAFRWLREGTEDAG